MPDTFPAALYLRHSPRPTGKDVERHESIEFQRERCLAYLPFSRPPLSAAYVLEDPLKSARKPLEQRPEGRRLIGLIRGGKVKHVVAQKLDRIFRNLIDGLTVLNEWEHRGVILHLADEGGVTATTATVAGWDFIVMRLWLAEHEPRQTSERTSAASRRYQSHGRRMSFIVPYGKQVDEQGDVNESSGLPSSLIDNEDELAVIGMMRTMRAEGAGYPKIAKQLNELGFQPRKGGQWNHVVVMRILKRMSHLNAGGSNGAG